MNTCTRPRLDSIADAAARCGGTRMNEEPVGELLLQCLGVGAGDPRRPLSEADWDNVVRESVRQGVASLLYHRLPTLGDRAEAPSRITRSLRELAIGSAVTSLRLDQELGQVLTALGRAGIDVIALKGAHLAEAVYANKGLRPMKDLDLMVKRCDLSRAQTTLLEMGYGPRPEPYAEWDYSDSQHLHPVTRPGGATIEIHWTIETPTAPFAIDVDGLWERARPATIAGVNVMVLSTEDVLLHLCLHIAFHHRFELGLRGCWDIREIIRSRGNQIDWEQVQARARTWGVRKYVYLTLYLAKELLGASVPTAVLAGLEPNGFDSRLVTLARGEMLRQTVGPSVSSRFARIWGASRIREKASLIAKALFPSRNAIGRMYPTCRDPRWLYCYYLVRWGELVQKYGRAVWGMMRRDEALTDLVRREHQRAVLVDWLQSASLPGPHA
jgi:Uncharacterised nucleotidyltransferase